MKKTFNNTDVGNFGEKICKRFLKRHKFKILGTNCRIHHLETDIIGTSKSHIVFVEVKTRRNDMNNFYRPSDAVDNAKKNNLISFAKAYSKKLPKKHQEKQIRIDVCEITVHQEKNRLKVDTLNYIENAISR